MSAGVAGASAWHGRRSEASEAPGEACCELQSDLLSDLLSRSSDADPPVEDGSSMAGQAESEHVDAIWEEALDLPSCPEA